MSELRFTEDHEWLRVEADGSVTVPEALRPYMGGIARIG